MLPVVACILEFCIAVIRVMCYVLESAASFMWHYITCALVVCALVVCDRICCILCVV